MIHNVITTVYIYDVYTHVHSTFMHTVDTCTCMYMNMDLHTCTWENDTIHKVTVLITTIYVQCTFNIYAYCIHVHTHMYMYMDLHKCSCTCTYHNMSQRRSTNSSESNFDSTLRVNGGFIARQLRT